jgi:hypothetical protein
MGLLVSWLPPLLLLCSGWGGLVKAVQSCRKPVCGDALEEKREGAEEGVELQKAPTMAGGMKIIGGGGSEGSTGLE